MSLQVVVAALKDITPLRTLFLQENNFQIRYNACHERGWTDSYLIQYAENNVGYGSVKGKDNLKDRNTVFEFYIIPTFKSIAAKAFYKLLQASQTTYIETQSNVGLLTTMLYQFANDVYADTILFEEFCQTNLSLENIIFRKKTETDETFAHKSEPVGTYVLEQNKMIVATGGFLLHYNMPFADLYMEVHPDHRRKGYGSFLIQEIKRECYLAGRVPAARSGIDNTASKQTLLKSGFKIAGYMLLGKVK